MLPQLAGDVVDARLVGCDEQIEALGGAASRQLVADARGGASHDGELSCHEMCSSEDQARACGPGLVPRCSAAAFPVALTALAAVLSLLAAVTLTALTLTALALTSVALTRLSAVLLLSVLRALAVLLVLAVRLVVLRTHCCSSLE